TPSAGTRIAPLTLAAKMAIADTLQRPHAEAGERNGGAAIIAPFFEWFGELAIFCGSVGKSLGRRPWEWQEFVRQLYAIGPRSVGLVALAGAATGVVLSLETRDSLARFGGKALLPAVIVFSLMRETGPIITALVASGRVGAGIGAELGSMK